MPFDPRLMLVVTALVSGATSAGAEQGVLVWNDPEAQAIRMIRFDGADLNTVTQALSLQNLSTVSATRTGVDPGGTAIGLCRQERDGNEAPAWLSGFDTAGRQTWKHAAGDYLGALEAVLPQGFATGLTWDWFTFECRDAGAGGKAGLLAFDVGFSAGVPDADGRVRGDDTVPFVGRLHVSASTGNVVEAALVVEGVARLTLAPNGRRQIYVDAEHAVGYTLGEGTGLTLPKGGRGQVLWNGAPFLWHGRKVGRGHDFAWHLPVVRAK